jgi:hypothetical protein
VAGEKYLIDEEAFYRVTDLPMHGDEIAKYLATKGTTQHKIYGIYNTNHKRCGVIISEINAYLVRVYTQWITYKILHTCTKEEYPFRVIVVAEWFVAGIHMAWAWYVLNYFIDDCLYSQDFEKNIFYSWILLLLAMVLWRPPQSFE